jgi:hypothetical protein
MQKEKYLRTGIEAVKNTRNTSTTGSIFLPKRMQSWQQSGC